MYAPYSARQIPRWYKILLGDKSVSVSDSDYYLFINLEVDQKSVAAHGS